MLYLTFRTLAADIFWFLLTRSVNDHHFVAPYHSKNCYMIPFTNIVRLGLLGDKMVAEGEFDVTEFRVIVVCCGGEFSLSKYHYIYATLQ